MKTIELFAGTESFSKVARERGHETFTVEIDKGFNPDMVADVLDPISQIKIWELIKDVDVVWMSPPCTTFSLASRNTHWTEDKRPKTENAVKGRAMLQLCKDIAKYCEENRKIYFIENPMARARWFMPSETLHHVWYCKYGDTRAKPTDIWTNLWAWRGKRCNNGNSCHESAPRGSKTGTQGLKGNKERSVIPPLLFHEIFDVLENKQSLNNSKC